VLETLSRAVTAAMADPVVQAALRAQGMEPVALDAAAFRNETETEIARYRIQAARAGLSVD